MNGSRALASALAAALAAAACAPLAPPARKRIVPAGSPVLPVYRPAAPEPALSPEEAELSTLPAGPPVTLNAVDVDVRALLVALAESAGISLVLDPAVQGRVTVKFTGVPAREALLAVAREAGLELSTGAPEAPVQPTVFYQLPVNVDEASAPVIQARFGVSAKLARWVVETRKE